MTWTWVRMLSCHLDTLNDDVCVGEVNLIQGDNAGDASEFLNLSFLGQIYIL